MANPGFSHPVLPTQKSLRVLTLHHGHWDERVRCTTSAYPMTQAPAYCALSYTWGSEADFSDILLNGSWFTIRHNLFRFLKRLRHPESDLKLWCDMICIDQHSLKERGLQVGMMGEIYKRAQCVWIWLGDQAEGSNVVFEFLDGEHNVLIRNVLTVDFSKRTVPQAVDIRKAHLRAEEIPKAREHLKSVAKKRYSSFKQRKFRARMNEAILKLLHREYWTRVWIIQEVTLAKRAVLYCGRQSLSWQCFWLLVDECIDCFNPITLQRLSSKEWPDFVKSLDHRWWIWLYRAEVEIWKRVTASNAKAIQAHKPTGVQYGPLVGLLEALRNAKCADARDRVYAAMAIVNDLKDLHVDYGKCPAEVFVDAVETMTIPRPGHQKCISDLAAALSIDSSALRQFLFKTRKKEANKAFKYFLQYRGLVEGLKRQNDCTEIFIRYSPSRTISSLKVSNCKYTSHITPGDQVGSLYLWIPTPAGLLQPAPECDKDLFCFLTHGRADRFILIPPPSTSKSPRQLRLRKIAELNAAFEDFHVQSDLLGHERMVKLNRMQHIQLTTFDLDLPA